MPRPGGPQRTCVGCGRVAGKHELLRVALAPGSEPLAVLDRHGRLEGRGAYLCRGEDGARPRPECLAEAIRRRGFARALRTKVTLDPKLVESVSR
jgi:predicted RNA-binding protein YlxR (DUF448 family)